MPGRCLFQMHFECPAPLQDVSTRMNDVGINETTTILRNFAGNKEFRPLLEIILRIHTTLSLRGFDGFTDSPKATS